MRHWRARFGRARGAFWRRTGCVLAIASTLAAIANGEAQGAPNRRAADAPVFNTATGRSPLIVGDSVVVWFDHDEGAVHRVRIGSARVTKLGRLGSGPMEFSRLSRLVHWIGDSVGVFDQQLRRMTVLSTATLAGRSFQLSTVPNFGSDDLVGVMRGPRLITRTITGLTEVGPVGAFQLDHWLRVVDPADGRESGRLPMTGAWFIRAATSNKKLGALIGGSPNPNYAVSAVATSRFAVTSGDRDTVTVADSAGRVRRTLILAMPRVTVSPAEQAKLRSDKLTALKSAPPDLLEQYARFVVVPPTRSRVMHMWLTDSSIWFVLEQPDSRRPGNLLVELDDAGMVKRCQPIDAGWRVIALGTRTMLVTRFTPEDEEDYDVYARAIATGCAVRSLAALFH